MTYSELRGHFDGNDKFMDGPQTRTARTGYTKRVRETPEWVNNDKAVQQILLRAFPKMLTSETQNKRASMWMKIIRLWWRAGMSEGQAVHAINEDQSWREHITAKHLQDTVRRIRNIAAGLTTSGKPRGQRPMGRPRKQPMNDGPDDDFDPGDSWN